MSQVTVTGSKDVRVQDMENGTYKVRPTSLKYPSLLCTFSYQNEAQLMICMGISTHTISVSPRSVFHSFTLSLPFTRKQVKYMLPADFKEDEVSIAVTLNEAPIARSPFRVRCERGCLGRCVSHSHLY